MNFTFTTTYNLEALTAMSRALRKTTGKAHSERMRLIGFTSAAGGVVLAILPMNSTFSFIASKVVAAFVIALVVFAFFMEDKLNAKLIAGQMNGQEPTLTAKFDKMHYVTITDGMKTEWRYSDIKQLAESENYFIFLFDENNVQVYDKRTLTGGSEEEFRSFITKEGRMDMKKV